MTSDAPESRLAVADAAAGRAEPWRDALARELEQVDRRQVHDPYLGWRDADFAGDHVNVCDGVRRSYLPAGSTSPAALDIAFLGGSAMFGIVQRDEHTIPSEFARLAEADGIRVRVANRGVDGYTNWQEALLLEQLVSAGRAPDLAVFYDGFNELAAQFQLGVHSEPTHLRADEYDERLHIGRSGDAAPALSAAYAFWAANSALHELLHRARRALAPHAAVWLTPAQQAGPPEPRGEHAAQLYARGVDSARGLAARHGFRAAFFWQPLLYGKRLAPGERALIGSRGTDPDAFRRAGAVARARLRAPVADLSSALDDLSEPVMYDPVHTNERGARQIAEAIYARLRPRLLALSRGGG